MKLDFNLKGKATEQQVEELKEAAATLSASLGKFTYNPRDPQEVERAITEMEAAVDGKLMAWSHNPLVQKMAEDTKEKLRKQMREAGK